MCVCQVNVCVTMDGQVIAAVVQCLKQLANQPMACYAAGGEDVCVASVCVMTSTTPETSARDVLLVRVPANHTGTCQFVFATIKHDGSFTEIFSRFS